MDALAPLTIDEAGYDYSRANGLFAVGSAIKTQEYEIKTPKRQGFTAVEWGGVMR